MNDVRSEPIQVATHVRRQAKGDAIFGATRDRHGRQTNQVAGRRKCRMIGGRRIDADVDALPKEIFDEAVQRAVRTVANDVVIARNKGDADFVRLHGQQHLKGETVKAMQWRP